MYQHWDANALVVLVTAISVSFAVLVHYEGLNLLSRWLSARHESHRRRKVLYGIFGVLALHVAEALANRIMIEPKFTPGSAICDRIEIAVGNTLLACVNEEFDAIRTSDLKHG